MFLVNNQLDAQLFFYKFISVLYMFRAAMCSSSGQSIVSIQYLVYVTLCGWPSGMQVWMVLKTSIHTCISDQTHSFFLYMFISIIYMFRATMCPSSGESIVSIPHLAYAILCRWPSGMQVWMFHPYLHTRQSSTQSDIYQVSHWYNWFSWWWAYGCPKHVENRNKHDRLVCR